MEVSQDLDLVFFQLENRQRSFFCSDNQRYKWLLEVNGPRGGRQLKNSLVWKKSIEDKHTEDIVFIGKVNSHLDDLGAHCVCASFGFILLSEMEQPKMDGQIKG